METMIKGQVIALGNNIDTDQIYPGRYLELVAFEELGRHCLEGVDPQIAKTFRKGDVIVAGTNFGCGSSREHAPIALQSMGASLVIAKSFARIFFRNAINLGLPLLVFENLDGVLHNDDSIEVDIEDATLVCTKTGQKYQGQKIGDHALDILRAGGIKPIMRERYGKKR